MSTRLRDLAAASGDAADEEPGGSLRPGTRTTRLGLAPHHVAGLAVFVSLLAVLVARNRFVFTHATYEDGDFAANAVLIDRARHFGLLIGNYSRVGFFHPGPALLYVQAWGQLVFHDLLHLTRTAFGGDILGVLVLNAALVGTSAAILARRTRSSLSALALLVAVLAVATFEAGLLSTTWMPDVYVWPFLLLLVAAASVATGEARHLTLLALAVGLLVHGHVSFVVIAGAIAALSVVGLVVAHRSAGVPGPTRRTLLATAAVLLLFATPIVVNTALHWPGELGKYWRYSRSDAAGGHTLGDSIRFVRDYWSPGRPGLILPLALIAAVIALTSGLVARPAVRGYLFGLVAVAVGATGATVFYAWRGVDDLQYRYVAFFYYAVHVVLLAALLSAIVLTARDRRGRLAVGAGLATAALLLAADPGLVDPHSGATWQPAAFAALPPSARPLALRFDANAWPPAGGLLHYAVHHGREACVENPAWALLYTTSMVCTGQQLAEADAILVQVPGTPGGGPVLYADADVVVRLPG